jgi:uncharacterized protein (DUF362 family)
MKHQAINRRQFLRRGAAFAAGAPLLLRHGTSALRAADTNLAASKILPASLRAGANVAIVQCRSYGPEVRDAFAKSFDLLGGIGSLMKNKTVTVKLNLTATNFSQFLGRPVGETYMTHEGTVLALTSQLFAAGAKRVRLVESTQSKAPLGATLALADWDVKALETMGKVEFENTRNLGEGKSYSRLKVPSGGFMFSSFNLNHAYEETDVMVSLAKLKNHITAGVTLSMKNLFGITPNSLYGDQAGSEDAIAGRGPLHNPRGFEKIKLPGLKDNIAATDPTWRVPRIIADVCGARPIDVAIIDGITAMSGGEGPWCGQVAELKATKPGVLIVGLNAVSTDAVGHCRDGLRQPASRARNKAIRDLRQPFAPGRKSRPGHG